MRYLLLLLVLVRMEWVLCSSCAISNHADRVKVIPGYPQGSPPSPTFSGYVHYEFQGQQVHSQYMLMMAEDAYVSDNATDVPLIYWSNGGPGASSMVGLWTELGPLLLNDLSRADASRTIPEPQYNPYAWTRLGHLLILNQPAPVGFSYCNDDPLGHNCGDITWNDELTAATAYQAFQAVLELFPCLASLDLFLTGESYGGIYIPTLAREFVKHDSTTLQGFAVGDGCLGTETDICGVITPDGEALPNYWDLLFLAGHGQIPLRTYKQVMDACRSHFDEEVSSSLMEDSLCKEAWLKVEKQVGGIYAYGLYDECTYENGLAATLHGGLNDYPCGGDIVMEQYFALDEVKEAFHLQSEFFQTDNAEGDFRYIPTEPDLRDFYKQMNGLLRIIVYNGDADPASTYNGTARWLSGPHLSFPPVNSFAAQNWTSRLGLDEEQEWRPWTVDGCRWMGGYVTRYEGDFDYLTIRGAGHMVPTIKPAASFAFMKAWINNEDYAVYDKDCKSPASRDQSSPPGDLVEIQ